MSLVVADLGLKVGNPVSQFNHLAREHTNIAAQCIDRALVDEDAHQYCESRDEHYDDELKIAHGLNRAATRPT